MDPVTAVGVLGGLVVIAVVNALEGGNLASLFLPGPMLLVFGVTTLVTVASGTLGDVKAVPSSLKRAFASPAPSTDGLVPQMVSLGETARREGLLSLERALEDVDDPFMVKGLMLAVDGTDPEDLEEILGAEIDAAREDGHHRAKFFADAGGFAPTIGIVGTVMSLVHVLENLSEPEALGHSIAAAFLATLWGVLSANVLWLPIANRLKRLADLEAARMEVVAVGVSVIQAGANPRVIEQRLSALVVEHGAAA
jgi:chemotaxis protein MotA